MAAALLVSVVPLQGSAANAQRFNPRAVSPRAFKYDNKVQITIAAKGKALCEVVVPGNRTTAFAGQELAAYLKQKAKVQQRIRAYLQTRPTHFELRINDNRFYVVHGFPGNNVHDEVWTRPTMESKNPIPDCRLIIGHTKVLSLIQPEEKRINYALGLESRGEYLKILHAPGVINLDCGCGYDMPIKALACIRLEDMVEYYI